ncbi:MAG: DUF2459 domain-containing protein [Hyphomonadaceae bacterium]|nr:DUF2459 domain-containing protein [Hyphomonadaceae bacterium]
MRWRAIVAGGVSVAALGWLWTGATPPLGGPPATRADCVDVRLWSNDWHTSFSLEASLLDADHPLRRLYPDARHLLVGWGDDAFYRSDGTDMGLGLRALAPGGSSVVHVIAAETPVETVFPPAEILTVGVSRAGARRLGDALAESLQRDPAGDAIPVAPGQHGQMSRFLAGRGDFHLFNVCNHWTARTLRRAGVDVNAAWAYRGDWLLRQVSRRAPSCAALQAAGP